MLEYLQRKKRAISMIKGYENSLIYVEGKGIVKTNLSIKDGMIEKRKAKK